jgi:PAS domain S-box-containing protein
MPPTQPAATIEHLLRLYLARSRDHAVICIDPAGKVLAWLGSAARIFGYEAAEMVGADASVIFTPEDRERGIDRYELLVAREGSRSEDDRWHVRKDGARIWVTGSVDALKDEDGRLLGYVKVLRDRTDLRAQMELVENQLDALKRSQERTRVFLSTLGHELRNPLAPMRNAGHIIRRLSTDPRTVTALDIIDRQVGVLSRLAEDLMEVSRLDAGKVALKTEKVDLCEVARTAELATRATADAKGVTLESLLPATPLHVQLDVERFERVVLNLLGNALKYTPRGGCVWLKATQEGDEALLRVEDTGIGIAPEVLPRIFDLFTQERQAADLVPGGLGIGLTIVKELVGLHGGAVQARSAGAGQGAEFTVRLPLAR